MTKLVGTLVDASQRINNGMTNQEGNIFTIPTVTMTIPRPIIAGVAAAKLLRGEHPVTPYVFASLVTDMEGLLARVIDTHFPNANLGSSPFGAQADVVADTAAITEIGLAAIVAPRMPLLGRAAVALVSGHEAYKGVWGLRRNRQYKQAGSENSLYIPPTKAGKESMAKKMLSVGLAVLSSDFDNPLIRNPLASASLCLAMSGTVQGEKQRRTYNEIATQQIATLYERERAGKT